MPVDQRSDSDSDSAIAGFLEGNVWEGIERSQPAGPGVEVGRRVGPYLLEEILGEGGFGVVFRASHDQASSPQLRVVAVKVLKTLLTPGVQTRFRREVEAMQSLSHPGIVSCLGSGTIEPGIGWLAMGLVEGRPIHDWCSAESLNWRQIVMLLVQVCHAVEHAHERGVLHRDIKPGNILVRPDGQPIVTDLASCVFSNRGPRRRQV